MRGRITLGKKGEYEACRYLMDRGHTILEQNWRSGHLEIDIISLACDGIHFVEVKSRVAPLQGEPQDAVNALKQSRIARAANKYLALKAKNIGTDNEVWFDVVAIVYDKGESTLSYFPAAYMPICV